jgi:putative PIG3 family NAD(P)H quinone oxidoreductase
MHESMRAIVFDHAGDESVLQLAEITAPPLSDGQVRLHVLTTAVNRADLLQRRGLYPPPAGASPLLGLECCGEVVELGPGVVAPPRGARVMALLAGGGYAEEVVVDARQVLPVPAPFSDEEAGGFMETFLTAFQNLFELAGLRAGDSALVHGGGSGVGTAAMALCREAGVAIDVTAGSDDKCQRCLALGARHAFNYRTTDFVAGVQEAGGVDAVLDAIGAPTFAGNLACLRPGGRLLLIGLSGGARGEVDLTPVLTKGLQVRGSTLRGQSASAKGKLVAAFQARFGEALSRGRLRPVIHAVLPLAEAARAHRLVQASQHFGKVVLRVR